MTSVDNQIKTDAVLMANGWANSRRLFPAAVVDQRQ